jgi:hypothetical protein
VHNYVHWTKKTNLETYHRYTPFWSTWVVANISMFGDSDNAVIGTSTCIASICLARITSQILRLRSILDDRSHFPSSLKHKSVIRSVWPSNLRTSLRATTSNNLIVKSSATVARRPEIHYKLQSTSWLKNMNYTLKIFSSTHNHSSYTSTLLLFYQKGIRNLQTHGYRNMKSNEYSDYHYNDGKQS